MEILAAQVVVTADETVEGYLDKTLVLDMVSKSSNDKTLVGVVCDWLYIIVLAKLAHESEVRRTLMTDRLQFTCTPNVAKYLFNVLSGAFVSPNWRYPSLACTNGLSI